MTRGKNSRHFRAIDKDFRGGKKKNKEKSRRKPRDCGSHRDVQQTCTKFDRVRRSSATRWPLKFPLLHIQVPANDLHRRDKRVEDNYFTTGEIREVYSGMECADVTTVGVLTGCNSCVFP